MGKRFYPTLVPLVHQHTYCESFCWIIFCTSKTANNYELKGSLRACFQKQTLTFFAAWAPVAGCSRVERTLGILRRCLLDEHGVCEDLQGKRNSKGLTGTRPLWLLKLKTLKLISKVTGKEDQKEGCCNDQYDWW